MAPAKPVVDGLLAATRLIKATQATRESRVIAYTGNASTPPPHVVFAAVQNAVNL